MEPFAIAAAFNLVTRFLPGAEAPATATPQKAAATADAAHPASFVELLDSLTVVRPEASHSEIFASKALKSIHDLPEAQAFLGSKGFVGVDWNINFKGDLSARTENGQTQVLNLSESSLLAMQDIYREAAQWLPGPGLAPVGSQHLLRLSAIGLQEQPSAIWLHAR